jgi:AraC-like DNA-binding protein/mannose-6-phosphate isomerase-like protein (cupin superfamily)
MQSYFLIRLDNLCIFAENLQILTMDTKLAYREIVYVGKSGIRSTYNSLGTQMDDVTQHGYERYHIHDDYQLMFLQEGKAIVTVDDMPRVCSPGDILLLGPKLPHKIDAYGKALCKGILIQFRQSLFPKDMQEIGDYHFVVSLLWKSMGGLLFAGHQASSAAKSRNRGKRFELFIAIHEAQGIQRLCLLLNLLDTLGRELESGTIISHLSEMPEKESLGAVVEKCKRYLKTNYCKDISLKIISLALGVNDTSLCRKFKKETGETVFQYLTHLRIEAACKILLNSKHSISETAYLCGFNTVTHFNRKFKEIMNMSPKEFRGGE